MLKVNGNGDATPGAGAAAAEDEEGPSLKQGQLIQFKWEDPTGWMGGVIVRKAKNYPQLKPPYIEVRALDGPGQLRNYIIYIFKF